MSTESTAQRPFSPRTTQDEQRDTKGDHEVDLSIERFHGDPPFQEIPEAQITLETSEQIGDDKMLVDFGHDQKLPLWADESNGHKMVAYDSGKQSVWSDDTQKIMVCSDQDDKEVWETPTSTAPNDPKPKRICGIRRRWFYAILIFMLIMAIGLGVGLGMGLSSSHDASNHALRRALASDYAIGGELDPAYYSETGAYNGSGISFTSQTFDNGTVESVFFWQHHDGSIRWMKRDDLDGVGWEGGTAEETVTDDARNNTPISSVSYTAKNISTWHLFYIDKSNVVREKVKRNTTDLWVEGALSKNSLIALDADMVGMQSCWHGALYNDSDYSESVRDNDLGVGMRLWFATDNETFHQLGWRLGDTSWTSQKNWTGKNGHAGIACYSWDDPPTTFWMLMVNQANMIEVWGRDTDADSTVGAPLNVWTNTTPSGFSMVHPSASLINVNLFYAQDFDDNLIGVYDISFEWRQTSEGNWNVAISDSFEITGHAGIPGTHSSATAIPNTDNGTTLWYAYQTVGDDISIVNRRLTGGNWTFNSLQISDA